MKYKHLLINICVCATAAIISLWAYDKLSGRNKQAFVYVKDRHTDLAYAGFIKNDHSPNQETPVDFSEAAEAVFPSVVRITTKINAQKTQQPANKDQADNILENIFGIDPRIAPEQRATGSGVIISANGYIVTNDHVISGTNGQPAAEITVTLNDNTKLSATLIGKDPATDLAVLKIKADDLTPVSTGNSDELKPGQWVLAVGYPLGLDVTVTAGIVSGKNRNIGINRRQSQEPVEAFIQTDATINMGNSGGALITANGELVGINAVMLASNGNYNGYGFAIPVNMVKKIAADLIRFGSVQKPWIGVTPSAQTKPGIKGVALETIDQNGPAYKAGLKESDIITSVNEVPVQSWNALQSQLLSLNPGNKIKLGFIREKKEQVITVELLRNPSQGSPE
ncbi:MAG: serine protease [Citrobacter freundii]|nr:MAG: serine protease [Citrobacter freundii]